MYASENGGVIPYGPKAPPFTSPADLYPSTGAVTSLISLMNGQPAGLGLLLPSQLSQTPKVLFCPSSDQPEDAAAELANVGVGQCSAVTTTGTDHRMRCSTTRTWQVCQRPTFS